MSNKIKMFVLGVVFVFCSTTGISCFATLASDYLIDDMCSLSYDVDLSSEEWYNKSMLERVEECDFPEEVLDAASTEILLNLAVDYPLGANLFLGDTFEKGFELLVSHSAVFREMLSRNDLNDFIVLKYRDIASSFEQEKDTLRKLMLESVIIYQWNSLSISERNTIAEIHDSVCDSIWGNYLEIKIRQHNKIMQLLDSVSDSNSVNPVFRGFVTNGNTIYNGYAYYLTGTYYKYGKSASCWKFVSGELTDQQKQNIYNEIAAAHPNWIYSTGATRKYNCHSYVWISNDTYNNDFWLNDPRNFAQATSYFSAQNTNYVLESGQYVIIYKVTNNVHSPVHSVKVNTSSSGSNTATYMSTSYVQSKLGQGGLYVTPMSDVFYYYSGNYYVPYNVL